MNGDLKNRAIRLRKLGKTYREILNLLPEHVAKSTISIWCRNTRLTTKQEILIARRCEANLKKARESAFLTNRTKREKYLKSLSERVRNLRKTIQNKNVAKIAIGMLYLGEGTKNYKRGSLTFGNSDPFIISLFLNLLRKCYNIDEKKFRCTVQCRADQNSTELEKFWHGITKIPSIQFYKTRMDARSVGKPSKKPDYTGVCRIDYFSADIFQELLQIPKSISNMGL